MNMKSDPVVIVSAARTPMGAFLGDFKALTAAELGAAAIPLSQRYLIDQNAAGREV